MADLRGASTIPMQTVKNLYLWNGRSYVRKAAEVPLAYFMSLAWPKERVMEVYLNVAQFGPGIFGAEAASRHYFHKSAANLTRGEAILLAAALPNPRVPQSGKTEPAYAAHRQGARPAHADFGAALGLHLAAAVFAVRPWPAPEIATIRAGSKASPPGRGR